MRLCGTKSAVTLVLFAAIVACGQDQELPEDDNLEVFIETLARCAYLERAYSHDRDLLIQQLEEVEIPVDLDSIADVLLTTYGADPDFWHEVYTEILERSRR